MAENLNFSVGAIGAGEPAKRIKATPRTICLDEAIRAINSLPVTSDQRKSLLGIARKMPGGSLHHLVSRYGDYLKKT